MKSNRIVNLSFVSRDAWRARMNSLYVVRVESESLIARARRRRASSRILDVPSSSTMNE